MCLFFDDDDQNKIGIIFFKEENVYNERNRNCELIFIFFGFEISGTREQTSKDLLKSIYKTSIKCERKLSVK